VAFNNVFSSLKHATLVAFISKGGDLILCAPAWMDYKNDAVNTFNKKYIQWK
jgi:hypothetical protein